MELSHKEMDFFVSNGVPNRRTIGPLLILTVTNNYFLRPLRPNSELSTILELLIMIHFCGDFPYFIKKPLYYSFVKKYLDQSAPFRKGHLYNLCINLLILILYLLFVKEIFFLRKLYRSYLILLEVRMFHG